MFYYVDLDWKQKQFSTSGNYQVSRENMGLQAHHQLECSKVVLVFEVKCHSFNIVVRIDLVSVSC